MSIYVKLINRYTETSLLCKEHRTFYAIKVRGLKYGLLKMS